MASSAQPNTNAQHSSGLAQNENWDVLTAFGLGLLVVDQGQRIVRRNQVADSLLPVADTLEETFAKVRLFDPFDGWDALIERINRCGSTAQFDAIASTDNREPAAYLNVRCAPFADRSDDDAPLTCLLIEKRDDPDMAASHMEVTHRLASLGKLAGKVAHELNNPLDGILRYVNLSLRLAEDNREPKLRTYLTESRDGLMRMVQIIADLLQFSRTSEGRFEESTVSEVIEQAVRSHANGADANGVIVAMDLQDRGMPIVRGSRLYQVCGNLIKNAIDAMPGGGRLTIVAGIEDRHVVIRVADTGIGLPTDVDRIFDLFFTTKKSGRGTGLGLAISKEFVEDMGGSIAVAPGDPKGAEFTVRIPVASFAAGSKPYHREARP